MVNYLIHCCPSRYWYVEEFLIPSLMKQGILLNRIDIFNDISGLGNLESFMQSCLRLPSTGGTWHLQDDVLIARDFVKRTNSIDESNVICGFCSMYDKHPEPGIVTADRMWFSFPCIYIPNEIARWCAEWFYSYCVNNCEYRQLIRAKRQDDTIFNIFMQDWVSDVTIVNLSPNLVEHVDYLIGGSIVNRRDFEVHSKYWNDTELVEELRKKLLDKCVT